MHGSRKDTKTVSLTLQYGRLLPVMRHFKGRQRMALPPLGIIQKLLLGLPGWVLIPKSLTLQVAFSALSGHNEHSLSARINS